MSPTKQSERLHEGGLRAWHPVVGPVLIARHRRAWFACALCFSRIRVGSTWALVTGVKGSGDAVENVMLPLTSFSMTGLVVAQWWSGEAYLWKDAQTSTGYATAPWLLLGIRMKSSDPLSDPTLVHDNARSLVAEVCRQFLVDEGLDTIDWLLCSPELNPVGVFFQ